MSAITLGLAGTTVTAGDAPVTLTAVVTNQATVPARIVLGAFGPTGTASPGGPTGPLAWTAVDRPLRTVAAGATEQYTISFAPPPGTAPGQYQVRFIAYDADRAPEEYSDQAQHVEVVVPSRPAPPAATGIPWWVYAVAAGMVVVIGVVAFFLLRPTPTPPLPPASPTPTPTLTPTPSPSPTNPCPAPYVPRLARAEDLTCVTQLSAAEAKADNDPELQKARKDPTGPYGPETCVQGYVWREAYDGDVTCVRGEVRTRTYWENQGYPEGTP
ncbi:MAG: hypothetical protein AAGC63_15580 [Propionicimonas sp.]